MSKNTNYAHPKIDREYYEELTEEYGSFQRAVKELTEKHVRGNETVENFLNRNKHIIGMDEEEKEQLKNSREINPLTIINITSDIQNDEYLTKKAVMRFLTEIYSVQTSKKYLNDLKDEYDTITRKEIVYKIAKAKDGRDYQNMLEQIENGMENGELSEWEEIYIIKGYAKEEVFKKKKEEFKEYLKKW